MAACSGSSGPTTIGIINDLNSLQPIVSAFEEEMTTALGSNVEFIYLDFGNDDFQSAIENLLEADPDLVVSLTTPNSLQAGPLLESARVPQIFGMVTDPVGTGLVHDLTTPGHDRTGVGLFHLEQTLDLAVSATGAKHVGVLHQPSDPASARGLTLVQRAADALGIELTVFVAEEDRDLDRVLVAAPRSGIDLLYLPGSPFAARNLGRISLVTRTWAIPTASALTVDTLPEGFMIGVAPDSGDMGKLMADRALAALNGANAGDLPIGEAYNHAILDIGLARRYGIMVPDATLTRFDTVIGGT